MHKYEHSEAFCLMKYRSDDGTEEEWIWNSRDGVTPFVITLRSGKAATHADWYMDRCDPTYAPRPGERIFVDLTRERAEEQARYYWENVWKPGLSDPDDDHEQVTEEEAIRQLIASYLSPPGTPDLIEVPNPLGLVF